MITCVRGMTVNELANRKDDLIISNEDIHEIAKNARNKAIDELTEEAMKRFTELELKDSLATATDFKIILRDVAEQVKGGAVDE